MHCALFFILYFRKSYCSRGNRTNMLCLLHRENRWINFIMALALSPQLLCRISEVCIFSGEAVTQRQHRNGQAVHIIRNLLNFN